MMTEFLGALDVALVLLEGIAKPTELEEFLEREFSKLTPCEWEKEMLENDLILGSRAPLRWLFKEAGVWDTEAMMQTVLELFYLQQKTKGSPLYDALNCGRLL